MPFKMTLQFKSIFYRLFTHSQKEGKQNYYLAYDFYKCFMFCKKILTCKALPYDKHLF